MYTLVAVVEGKECVQRQVLGAAASKPVVMQFTGVMTKCWGPVGRLLGFT